MKILEAVSKKPDDFFGKLFWNFLFAYIPFCLLLAILSLFEIAPVSFNGDKVYGIKGFAIVIIYIPFLAFTTAFTLWLLFSFGNLIIKALLNIFKK